MVKLFRQTRQQLAAENKPGQYLRYAIGEIFLVVIGILIALQANDWSESRKEERIHKKDVTGLISNLELDLYIMNWTIDQDSVKLNKINYILTKFKDGSDFSDSSQLAYYSEILAFYDGTLQRTVFEDMRTGGRLNYFLDDSIRSAIVNHYLFMEMGMETSHLNTQYIMNQIIPSLDPYLDYNSLLHRFSTEMGDDLVEVDPFRPPLLQLNGDATELAAFVDVLSMLYMQTALNYTSMVQGRTETQKLVATLEAYHKTL